MGAGGRWAHPVSPSLPLLPLLLPFREGFQQQLSFSHSRLAGSVKPVQPRPSTHTSALPAVSAALAASLGVFGAPLSSRLERQRLDGSAQMCGGVFSALPHLVTPPSLFQRPSSHRPALLGRHNSQV